MSAFGKIKIVYEDHARIVSTPTTLVDLFQIVSKHRAYLKPSEILLCYKDNHDRIEKINSEQDYENALSTNSELCKIFVCSSLEQMKKLTQSLPEGPGQIPMIGKESGMNLEKLTFKDNLEEIKSNSLPLSSMRNNEKIKLHPRDLEKQSRPNDGTPQAHDNSSFCEKDKTSDYEKQAKNASNENTPKTNSCMNGLCQELRCHDYPNSEILNKSWPENLRGNVRRRLQRVYVIKNTGTSPWPNDTKFEQIEISKSLIPPVFIGSVNPGEIVNAIVDITFPDKKGEYTVEFKLRSYEKFHFGLTTELSFIVSGSLSTQKEDSLFLPAKGSDSFHIPAKGVDSLFIPTEIKERDNKQNMSNRKQRENIRKDTIIDFQRAAINNLSKSNPRVNKKGDFSS